MAPSRHAWRIRSLAATVWMPHQKAARETLAARSAGEAQLQSAQARLAVAGEVRARASGRGIWSSAFQPPGDFRSAGRPETSGTNRAVAEAPQARPSAGCVIKGNRSRRGSWIYHLPGMPYYGQTRAEEMFCTEAEAQAAGYRRAQVR